MRGRGAGRVPAGQRSVYADHAATSWPKPAAVARALVEYLEQAGANPGRSAHRQAVASARAVFVARQAVARLLGARDESRVIFGPNATWAINLALYGLLEPGDRVVTSAMEHNAVVRPLHDLTRRGVEVTRVRCTPEGYLDLDDLRRALRRATHGQASADGLRDGARCSTRGGMRRGARHPMCLLVLTHASNVTGTILPVVEAARLAHEHGALVLVDAAQTAGCLPLDVTAMDLDLVAFTGHKGLLGPQGTGGLYIREGLTPRPLVRGGTGSFSHLEEQPPVLPDLYESGTLNGVGLAGLGAAAEYVAEVGIDRIRQHEEELTRRLLRGLEAIPGVRVYGPRQAEERVAVVSFNVLADGPAGAGGAAPAAAHAAARPAGSAGEGGVVDPALVADLLDSEFGVMVRAGLHCAPWAHRTVGSYPQGTVRMSLGYSNTPEEVDYIVSAVAAIASRFRRAR
ncbi:MAG: aminotransferase class V-fold PLP-dependent enzyme [Bacillota bacterium]|nr:aminotransferase class V-fold PLP-dependent enzyme [Bacillota bacterium]